MGTRVRAAHPALRTQIPTTTARVVQISPNMEDRENPHLYLRFEEETQPAAPPYSLWSVSRIRPCVNGDIDCAQAPCELCSTIQPNPKGPRGCCPKCLARFPEAETDLLKQRTMTCSHCRAAANRAAAFLKLLN